MKSQPCIMTRISPKTSYQDIGPLKLVLKYRRGKPQQHLTSSPLIFYFSRKPYKAEIYIFRESYRRGGGGKFRHTSCWSSHGFLLALLSALTERSMVQLRRDVRCEDPVRYIGLPRLSLETSVLTKHFDRSHIFSHVLNLPVLPSLPRHYYRSA